MEPGDGAMLQDGWWIYAPKLPPQREIVLAASGATGEGWKLCAAQTCREIGAIPGQPVDLKSCAGDGSSQPR